MTNETHIVKRPLYYYDLYKGLRCYYIDEGIKKYVVIKDVKLDEVKDITMVDYINDNGYEGSSFTSSENCIYYIDELITGKKLRHYELKIGQKVLLVNYAYEFKSVCIITSVTIDDDTISIKYIRRGKGYNVEEYNYASQIEEFNSLCPFYLIEEMNINLDKLYNLLFNEINTL